MSRNYQSTEEFVQEGERHADRLAKLIGETADPLCPTDAQKRDQGARCGCRGADDYCSCQNVVRS